MTQMKMNYSALYETHFMLSYLKSFLSLCFRGVKLSNELVKKKQRFAAPNGFTSGQKLL